jgi:hypothetical protein
LSRNNITIISIPIDLNYIVLVHDLLNYIKMRKTSINTQQLQRDDETKLIQRLEEMSIDDQISLVQYDDKENCSFISNTGTLIKEGLLQSPREKNAINSINISRLKKIDKPHFVSNLLNKLDFLANKIENKK